MTNCYNPWDSIGFRIFSEGGGIPNPVSRKPLRNTAARRTAILALDGDKWKPRPVYRTRQGGNGFGINYEQIMYTLNTVDKHIVAIL